MPKSAKLTPASGQVWTDGGGKRRLVVQEVMAADNDHSPLPVVVFRCTADLQGRPLDPPAIIIIALRRFQDQHSGFRMVSDGAE